MVRRAGGGRTIHFIFPAGAVPDAVASLLRGQAARTRACCRVSWALELTRQALQLVVAAGAVRRAVAQARGVQAARAARALILARRAVERGARPRLVRPVAAVILHTPDRG
ncbi:hypothetical protein JYU34_014857 [Plutella xylostella]|uniref:Uncharacterized protein n=1 Tax=Plutella xylostella TaxID=51655 RepID=A0ABQ7Q5P4_PLUXY|nr:hypothetical protein JYU34_014857 [Plutella xylostella]